ncbi:hypothetical protein PQR53_08440 [Paraburkholderia fungorum]|uniref:hypothetical protein n=1 Tax=Paraburkholderia fungorum TaxID=134537 RepID=UPI0038BDCA56
MSFPRSQIGGDAAAPARFSGSLPGSGSASVQSRSWSTKGGTGWQGSVAAGAGNPVQYSRDVDDAINAGNSPVSLTDGRGVSHRYDESPVGYVRAAGLNPVSQTDVAALNRWPELALYALAETVKANAFVKNSTSTVVGTRIHASLGSNAPAEAKASFSFVPLAAVQASLTRSW